jgi:cobalamin biosynthesis Mg chelatase CobN
MRHSARARARVAFACAALLAATPVTALAAGNPLHVDPKSPVAKEYALPLATARGAAPESGQPGALFGSGIKSSGHTSTPASTDTKTPAVTTAPIETTTPAAITATETRTSAATTGSTATETVSTTAAATLTSPLTVRQRSPGTAKPGSAVEAVPAAYRILRPGSGFGLFWMILAAVVVIALGSAGGVALRRGR